MRRRQFGSLLGHVLLAALGFRWRLFFPPWWCLGVGRSSGLPRRMRTSQRGLCGLLERAEEEHIATARVAVDVPVLLAHRKVMGGTEEHVLGHVAASVPTASGHTAVPTAVVAS